MSLVLFRFVVAQRFAVLLRGLNWMLREPHLRDDRLHVHGEAAPFVEGPDPAVVVELGGHADERRDRVGQLDGEFLIVRLLAVGGCGPDREPCRREEGGADRRRHRWPNLAPPCILEHWQYPLTSSRRRSGN